MGSSVYFYTRKTEKCPHCGETIKTVTSDEVAWWNKYDDLSAYVFEKYYPDTDADKVYFEYFEITEEIIVDIIDKVEKGLIEDKYGSSLPKLNGIKNTITLSGENVYMYIT